MNNSFADYFNRAKLFLRGSKLLSRSTWDNINCSLCDFLDDSASFFKTASVKTASASKTSFRAVRDLALKVFDSSKPCRSRVSAALSSSSLRTRGSAIVMSLLLAFNIAAISFIVPTSNAKYVRNNEGVFSLKLKHHSPAQIQFTKATCYGFNSNHNVRDVSTAYPNSPYYAEDNDKLIFQPTTAEANFEKICIPIVDLIPGTYYKVPFTEVITNASLAHNGSWQHHCCIVDSPTINQGAKVLLNEDIMWFSTSLDNTSGDDSIYFLATDSTMYWIWEFGDVADNTKPKIEIDATEVLTIPIDTTAPYLAIETAECTGSAVCNMPNTNAAVDATPNSLTYFVYDNATDAASVAMCAVDIKNLEVGEFYKLTFGEEITRYNSTANVSFSNSYFHGSTVIPASSGTPSGKVLKNTEYIWSEPGTAAATITNDGCVYFKATEETMKWITSYGSLSTEQNVVNLTDIAITKIENPFSSDTPYVDFPSSRLTSGSVSTTASNNKVSALTEASYDPSEGVTCKLYSDSAKEQLVIPITNLKAGQTYKLDFNEKLTAGGITTPLACTIASTVPATGTLTTGNIWADTSKVTTGADGSLYFTADSDTMYWVWDLQGVQNSVQNSLNITATSLEAVSGSTKPTPAIDYPNASAVNFTANGNTYNPLSSIVFVDGSGTTPVPNYDGMVYTGKTTASNNEKIVIPITGLTKGDVYTLDFDYSALIGGADNTKPVACTVQSTVPTTVTLTNPANLWASTLGGDQSLTFVAESDTMYWVWDLSQTNNSVNAEIKIDTTTKGLTDVGSLPTGPFVNFNKLTTPVANTTNSVYSLYTTHFGDIDTTGASYAYDLYTKGSDKVVIPVENLEVGHLYKLAFNHSYTDPSTSTAGIASTVQASDNVAVKPITNFDGKWASTAADGRDYLYFYATAETMYWTWDYNNLTDSKQDVINFSGVALTDLGTAPAAPYFAFPEATMSSPQNVTTYANVTEISEVSFNGMTFKLHANGTTNNREKLNIPIRGLEGGKFYKLTYDLSISSSAGMQGTSYQIAAAVKPSADTGTGALTANASVPAAIGNGLWIAEAAQSATSYSGSATVYFYVPAGTTDMSWIMDLGKLGNNSQSTVSISNVSVEEATDTTAPGFNKDAANFGAAFGNLGTPTVSGSATSFTFSGTTANNTNNKTVRVPIVGLIPGENYTIKFKLAFNSATINNASNTAVGISTSSSSTTAGNVVIDKSALVNGELTSPLERNVTIGIKAADASDTVYLYFNFGNDPLKNTPYSISLSNLSIVKGTLGTFSSVDPNAPAPLGAKPPVPVIPDPVSPTDVPASPSDVPSAPAEPAAPSEPAEPSEPSDPAEPPAETPAQNPPESAPEPEPTPAPEA